MTKTETPKTETPKSVITQSKVNFYKEHTAFIDWFSQLKECTTETIEELSTKIVEYVKGKEKNKVLMEYVKKRLYSGLCGKTNATRRGYSVSLIRLLRAVPELQASAYPDMIKYTKKAGKIPMNYVSQWYIGRIFGYNILLRLGLMKNIRHELLMKIISELVKYSRDSLYVEDLCITTICAIYDQTEETDVADAVWRSLPNEPIYWTPFHIGAACHFLWRDHNSFKHKTKKKFTDSSLFVQVLFERQCSGEGDTACFAWKALARYAMKDEELKWEEFWWNMKPVLTRAVNKTDFTYHAFTSVISALPGNPHLIERVLGNEFAKQFAYWKKMKLNLYILQRVFTGFLEIEDAEFLYQLAASLMGIKSFDKLLGAPIYAQIREKPVWKTFDFGVITERLVKQWLDLRKPLMEATPEEEEEIDEVEIEKKCTIIEDKIQRLCCSYDFVGTANPDWWLPGLKHLLRYSSFYKEVQTAKQEVKLHYSLAMRPVSIITSKITLSPRVLKDEDWKIDRIFELVDPEAMLEQYGPRLMNNEDPTKDFQNAKTFLEMMPTMELTDVQRRLCEITVKTCRLMLITGLYGPCSKVLEVLLEKELTTIQDKMFEVVLVLLQSMGKLLYKLSLLIWKSFASTATTKQIEQLIELASPESPEAEKAGDTDDEDSESSDTEESLEPESNKPKEENVDTGEKSMDVDEPAKKEGEDDTKVTEALGEQALKKDNGDKANEAPDIKEDEEKANEAPDIQKNAEDDQGSKSEQNDDAKKSSGSAVEDDGPAKGGTTDEEATDIEMNPPTEKDLSMLKDIRMAIMKKRHEGHLQKVIQAKTAPKIMRLLEMFCEARPGDSLVLTVIIPMLERYCGDPNGYEAARNMVFKITKRRELPLEGVNMATMEDIMDDIIQITLRSKLKSVMEWVHYNPLLWLFKLYFRIATKEEKVAEAMKWVQEQYNKFWTGLIEHRMHYRAVSLPIFKDAYIRYPDLVGPMINHVVQTVMDDKIPHTFDMFQALTLIYQAAVWRQKSVRDTLKALQIDYAKTFCIILPKLVKKIHKKGALLNFTKFVGTLDEKEKSSLIEGSDLKTMLSKMQGQRVMRLKYYLLGEEPILMS